MGVFDADARKDIFDVDAQENRSARENCERPTELLDETDGSQEASANRGRRASNPP